MGEEYKKNEGQKGLEELEKAPPQRGLKYLLAMKANLEEFFNQFVTQYEDFKEWVVLLDNRGSKLDFYSDISPYKNLSIDDQMDNIRFYLIDIERRFTSLKKSKKKLDDFYLDAYKYLGFYSIQEIDRAVFKIELEKILKSTERSIIPDIQTKTDELEKTLSEIRETRKITEELDDLLLRIKARMKYTNETCVLYSIKDTELHELYNAFCQRCEKLLENLQNLL